MITEETLNHLLAGLTVDHFLLFPEDGGMQIHFLNGMFLSLYGKEYGLAIALFGPAIPEWEQLREAWESDDP